MREYSKWDTTGANMSYVGMRSRIAVWILGVAVLAAGVPAEEGKADRDATGEEGAPRQAFLNNLIEKKDSGADCHDLLKRRLLEGHFEDVKAGLDLRDDSDQYLFQGYRFAQLRALCARAIFREYNFRTAPLGWPSEEEGARYRQLAAEVTAAYEEAFKLAPSDFERACIYARWHEIHTSRRFEADSRFLRTA